MVLSVFDLRIEREGAVMYPHVRQFETRALEVEGEARLAHERRAAADQRKSQATSKQPGWNRILSSGRPVPPRLGDCRD